MHYVILLCVVMPWLFTEYDEARNSHVLHSNFSIPRATSYSVNSQPTIVLLHIMCSLAIFFSNP